MRSDVIEVRNPFTRALVGSVPKASAEQVAHALDAARAYKPALSRHERAAILDKAAQLVRERAPELAALITAESGLSLKDSTYETGRVADVLGFGASEALKDDGQTFSCDITPHGRRRRVHTLREPLLGVITAITPFNHPMNQVAHKVVPAVASNNRMVLKPSEKVPLSALRFAELLYEAGLPRAMLTVVTGDPREIADVLITHPAVDLVTFTGGVAMGTVIDETAARLFEARVNEAVAQGARLLVGNRRDGALYSPTVLDRVRPEMTLVREETFGPVSPILTFANIDEAIALANGTAYGLSSSVCTQRWDHIARFVQELQVGTVNVREVPGYRLELTPFGGIKDSGLGYKEGVQEAMKSFTNLKTYSLPWA